MDRSAAISQGDRNNIGTKNGEKKEGKLNIRRERE